VNSQWILVLWINSFGTKPAVGEEYQLEITHPDGLASRRESTTEDGEGNPQVEGEIQQRFQSPHAGTLVLIYKSGSNGYRTRYTYEADSQRPKNETFSIKRIGANALKSSVG
ncbi:hypothetical protein KR067_001093, partial [Drosophila pandora]